MGFIKNLLNGILGFLKSLLSFGSKKKSNSANSVADAIIAEVKQATNGSEAPSSPAPKAEPAPEAEPVKTTATKPAQPKAAVFLEGDDARGYSANAKPAASQSAKTLNLPQPKVTTSNSKPQAGPAYAQFGSRRRPGSNMKSYLDMAKTVNSAN